ncbi:hypothetical protein HOP50_12g65250 [Chloropicon primus]|nr:hypothetical protein HOP50_12g65250 [Chloropicon primus]
MRRGTSDRGRSLFLFLFLFLFLLLFFFCVAVVETAGVVEVEVYTNAEQGGVDGIGGEDGGHPPPPPYFGSVDLLIRNGGSSSVDLGDLTAHFFLGEDPSNAHKYDGLVWSALRETREGSFDFVEDVEVTFTECHGNATSWSAEAGARVRMDIAFGKSQHLPPASRALVRTRVTKRVWPREPLDDVSPWSHLRELASPVVFSALDSNQESMVHFAENRRVVLSDGSGKILWGHYPSGYDAARSSGEELCGMKRGGGTSRKTVANYARRSLLQNFAQEVYLQEFSLPCEDIGSVIRMDSRFDESLPQLQYVKLLISNEGEAPASLDGLRIPFPYRELGEEHKLVAACTNPVLLGSSMTNAWSDDICDHIDITVSEDEFVVEFKNFTLCPYCRIDAFSDALSLFAVYDEHWQRVQIEVTLGASSCASSGSVVSDPSAHMSTLSVNRVKMDPGNCHTMLNVHYGGTILSKPELKASSATECCDLCHKEPTCNVWTWCDSLIGCSNGEEDKCVLKYEVELEPTILSKGKYTPWASGYLGLTQEPMRAPPTTVSPTYTSITSSCTSEISGLAAACTNGNMASSMSVSQCCQRIAETDSMCLCNKDFGFEMAAMQESLETFSESQCSHIPCASSAIAAPIQQKSLAGSPLSRKSGTAAQGQQGQPAKSQAQGRAPLLPPNCGLENIKTDLVMESNSNYNKIFLVGSLTNTARRSVTLGDFTVPIFFSRGAKGYDNKWYRANPDEFVVECKDPVITTTQFGTVERRRMSCDNMKVTVDEEGILFMLRGVELCPGCSIGGSQEMPMWEIRHAANFPLDFIHINPALASNGPIIGKPFCDTFEDSLEIQEALEMNPMDMNVQPQEISDQVWREPSDTNTAQDLLLGTPTSAGGLAGSEPGIGNAAALNVGQKPYQTVTPDQLRLLAPGQAAMLLKDMHPAAAAQALAGLQPQEAIPILQAMSPADAGKIADAMPGPDVADLLRYMQPNAASQLVAAMSPVVAASALQQLQPQQAQAILSLVDNQHATRLQNAMPPASASPGRLSRLPPAQAAALLQQLYPAQAAAALRGLTPAQAAAILEVMPPEDAAQIMDVMPGGAAADLLGAMDPYAAQQLFSNMSPVVSADALRQMPPEKASALMTSTSTPSSRQPIGAGTPIVTSQQLAAMSPAQAAMALRGMSPMQAAEALAGLEPWRAAPILQALSPTDAGPIMDSMPGTEIAGILRYMDPAEAAALLEQMSPVVAASALQQLQPQQAQTILGLMDNRDATRLQNAMPPASASPLRLSRMSPAQAATLLQQLYPTQAAAALRGLTPAQAAAILEVMPPEDAAQIMDVMPGGAAADLLGAMDPYAAQQLFSNMSPVVSADALRQMPPEKASALMTSTSTPSSRQPIGAGTPIVTSQQLAAMSPAQAAMALRGMSPMQAAEALAGLEPWRAAPILQALSPTDAGPIMDSMPGTEIAGILRYMDPAEAAALLEQMSPVVAASALQQLQPQQAQTILGLMDNRDATRLQNAMPPASASPLRLSRMSPAQAATLLQQLYPTQAAAALRGLTPAQAAAILEVMPPEDAAQIMDVMPGGAAADLLGAMDPYAAQQLLNNMSPLVRANALRHLGNPSAAGDLAGQDGRFGQIQNDGEVPIVDASAIHLFDIEKAQQIGTPMDLNGLTQQEKDALLAELLARAGRPVGSVAEQIDVAVANSDPVTLPPGALDEQANAEEEGILIEFSRWAKKSDLWEKADASEFELSSPDYVQGEAVLVDREDSIEARLPTKVKSVTLKHKLDAELDPRTPTISTASGEDYEAVLMEDATLWLIKDASFDDVGDAIDGAEATGIGGGKDDTVRLVSDVSPLQAARVLDSVDDALAADILAEMPLEDIARVIALLPADRAKRLIELLPKDRQEELIPLLDGVDAIAFEAIADFMPCESEKFQVSLRSKVLNGGTRYGITGTIENPTNQTLSLKGLEIRVGLSPWVKDATGVWERADNADYTVRCAWLGIGSVNFCDTASVVMENHTAVITLQGQLRAGEKVSGPPDGILMEVGRRGRALDLKNLPLIGVACPGQEVGQSMSRFEADQVGAGDLVTIDFSPWMRAAGSSTWQRGSEDEFSLSCKSGADACPGVGQATLSTSSSGQALEASFVASEPVDILLTAKDGSELDFREPIVTSGFDASAKLVNNGTAWDIQLSK